MTNYKKKILGSDPAATIAAVEAILAFIVLVPALGISQEAAGVIMTVVVAIGAAVQGWTTVNTRLSLAVGVIKTVLVGLAYFGALSLDESQITMLVAAIAAVGGAFIRQNNAASVTILSNASPGTLDMMNDMVSSNKDTAMIEEQKAA